MENIAEKERLVDDCLCCGNKQGAIKLLLRLVAARAGEKNFEAAEAVRSRIFEIDDLALSEIIRAGEIIEEAKRKAIDKNHREIWAGLYETLSVEEANTLYYALQKAAYRAGETIFEEGERKPRLYFVNSGHAKIVYFHDGMEIFLKDVQAGQFAGEDVFFSFTVCTTTMIAQSRTEVSCLDSEILQLWKTDSPMLESKLQSFVSSAEKIADLLKAGKGDRRRLRRIKITGKAAAILMNASEKQVGKPFSVDVCDLSRGGVCFTVRVTRREAAGRLLGKRISICYPHPKEEPPRSITQRGRIAGFRFHPFEDCTVHVKFDTLLPEGLLEYFENYYTPPNDFDF